MECYGLWQLKHKPWGDQGTCLPLGRLRVMILSVSGPKDCEERKREEGGKEWKKKGERRERREKGEREEEEREKKGGREGRVRERDEGEGTLQG